MRLAYVLLLAILTACGGGGEQAAAAPVAQPLLVYLFMGQSNMVGVAGIAKELPPELRTIQPAVIYDGQWKRLVAPEFVFGPEISFAARKGSVGIVKFAVNSTSLADDWIGPRDLLSQAIAHAKAAAGSRPIHFAGAFWMQGESDTCCEAQATSYAANLRTLVARLRTELQADLPFTVCRINTPVGGTFPFRDTVRAAQENPGIANYRMVDCDGLTIGPDRLHFDTAGIVKMGELFADDSAGGSK